MSEFSLTMLGGMAMSTRARPLAPDARRNALITAALPLVRAHGSDVTTRQLAEASGVAEGTIFRVFPDKESLIRATIETACDPAPVIERLARIELSLPLRPRLVAAVTIIQAWIGDIIGLMMAIRQGPPPRDAQARRRTDDQIATVMMPLIEADRTAFRCPPAEVARLLKLLVSASAHPILNDGNPLSADELVGVLLDGVLAVHDGTYT